MRGMSFIGKFKILILLLFFFGCAPAFAEALLDSPFKDAGKHDFVSYFAFKENKSEKRGGLLNHFYYSKSWTSSLVLSEDKNNKIVHMKLSLPRPLIDDEKVCTRGRDLVKSFVLASALAEDLPALKELADEIYIRGLELTPINNDGSEAVQKDKSVPRLQAYKVGKGPVANGDNAIFLSSTPQLPPKASPLFEVVAGKSESLGRVYKKCRLAFINQKMSKSGIQLLLCETWDEAYFQAQLKKATPAKKTVPVRKTAPAVKAVPTVKAAPAGIDGDNAAR